MNNDFFSAREQEIFHTLKKLKGNDFVVIGGYAVNAYTLPRFSVDCDIVVMNIPELHKTEKILSTLNYERVPSGRETPYSGNFARWEKTLSKNIKVSMDIMVEKVLDRMTEVSFSAAWIFQNSTIRSLRGKTITEELSVPIINSDALMVMKIISCRSTDIRDVFMMITKVENKVWIKTEISVRYNFKERLAQIVDKVSAPQFRDDLSGVYGYFDPKVFEKHLKEVLLLQRM